MNSPRVLIAGKAHPILIQNLSQAGFICDILKKITVDEIKEKISFYDGVIVRSKVKLNKEIINEGRILKFIGRIGAGIENIDITHAKNKGIHVINSPEGNKDALAEHSIGMILSLMNNLNCADREVKDGLWNREKNRGHEIMGKTVGIIGCGNMGSAFAQRLSGFNVKVIAYDKYKTGFSNEFVKECTLNELFKESDILSINLPLTDETRFIINDSFLTEFTKPIYLLNTSRGNILKTEDLLLNIDNGNVLGAALDVLEFESSSFEGLNYESKTLNQLQNSNKVILSPHIAGWSLESEFKLSKVLAEKIINLKISRKL